MKKRGLIVSTIVMIVVLAIAVTTATYAWFSVEATATVTDIEIITKANDGLTIASYYGGNYYNGDLTLDATNKYWGATTPSGFGTELRIGSQDGTPQISDIYAASGDGSSLFINAAGSGQELVAGKPEALAAAGANENYFVLDFALQNASAANGDIFIKNITVTPTGTTGAMAGSARIAFFATMTDPTTGYPTYSVATDGKFLYDPYQSIQRSDLGQWTTSAVGNKYATKADEYAASMSADTLQALWDAKYLSYGALTVGTHYTAAAGPAMTALSKEFTHDTFGTASSTAIAMNVAGNSAGTVWVRMVVWFDGEDAACVQATAGGGIKVGLEFGLTKEVTP